MQDASWLAPEADVQRRRRATPHVDLRDVGAVSALANLDRVRSFRHIDDESLLTAGSPPHFTIDRDFRVARLHANRERSIRFRLTGTWRRTWRRRRRATSRRCRRR